MAFNEHMVNHQIGRIRRPPPPTFELVLAHPEEVEEQDLDLLDQFLSYGNDSYHLLIHDTDSPTAELLRNNAQNGADALLFSSDDTAVAPSFPRPQAATNSCLGLPPHLSMLHVLSADEDSTISTEHSQVQEVNYSNNLHTNALCCAVNNGDEDIIQFLLHHGADPTIKDQHGSTAMHYAAKNGNEAILGYLLAKQVNLDVQDCQGRTPLFVAIQNGDVSVVSLLLRSGANVYVRDNFGKTALYLAVASGSLGLVKILVEFGADVNA